MRLDQTQDGCSLGAPGAAVRRGRLALASTLVVIVAALAASTAPLAQAASVNTFCGLSAGIAKTALSPTSSITPTAIEHFSLASLEARLKTSFEKFKTDEPIILANAPSQIRGDLVKIFAVDDKFVADLEKVNFNFMALLPDEKALQTAAQSIKPYVTAVSAYFKTSCGIK